MTQWYGYQVFKFQSPVYSYANSFIMKAWHSWTIYNIFPVNEIIIQTLAGKNIRNVHYCKCISHLSTQHKGNIMQQFCLPIFSDFKENHRRSWIYLFILFVSTLWDTYSKSFHPHPRWNQWEFCIDFSATTILVAVSTLSLSGLREVLKKISQTAPWGSNSLQSLFMRQREKMFLFFGETMSFIKGNNLCRDNLKYSSTSKLLDRLLM